MRPKPTRHTPSAGEAPACKTLMSDDLFFFGFYMRAARGKTGSTLGRIDKDTTHTKEIKGNSNTEGQRPPDEEVDTSEGTKNPKSGQKFTQSGTTHKAEHQRRQASI